ncbi:MAG: hypothetical protein ACR2PG_22360, partial [Hyphomicrobiaceae bacterium]
MVTAKRRRRHATIAAAMREFYGARIQEYTEELAHHLTKAGAYTDAIEQWQRAAQRALMNAANAEAVEALETAIGLLAHLPDDPVHLRKGLELQSLLGSVLIVARGPGSPEVEKVYEECRRLANELGEAQALFRSIWGQWRIAWKVPNKIAIARQLNEIADKHSQIEFCIQAHHAQWASCYNGGELRKCLGHITDGLASYDERLHGELLLHYGGHDPAVCGYGEAALCHWILGDPTLGAKMAQSAIDQALRLKHAGSIGHAYDYALFYLQHSDNPREALQTANKAIKFAEEMGLPHYAARARAWRGWAISQIDSVVDGIGQMQTAVDEQRQTGVEEDFPVFLEVLAGLEAGIGRYDVAHSRCQEALDLTRTSGMRHWLAEIMRREAVVRAKLVPDKLDACVASLVEARAVAEKQQAAAIEARILADLRRLDERKELRNVLPDFASSGVAPQRGDHQEMRT